ncbi:MAG: prepilin-type N-terminal cleavage/methylation domain-containing protein [Candidatus Sulfotelmatobacter sp.]
MVSRRKSGRSFGFTLLEMMIVIIIMGILLSIAIPIYNQSIVRARESVLHNDLFELRHLIYQYTLDKQKAPQSLDDLVSAGYIKQVPKDPMTNEANWEPQQEDVLLSVDQQDPGIDDVHSASTAMSTEGTPYNTW